MDGGVAFGVVPRTIWGKYHNADDNNLIPIKNRILLVETGDRIVIIDTGFGNKRDEKYYRYKYIFDRRSLSELLPDLGYRPEDVTDVILTHLHDDHVGGAVVCDEGQLKPVFPNATHWLSEQQFKWANDPNPREAASFFTDNYMPIHDAGKLKLVSESSEVLPGIEIMLCNGHTTGMMVPMIRTGHGVVTFLADFIPSKSHIPIPYLASVDIQPLVALKEKEEFLNKAFAENHILVFEHDFDNEACRLVMGEKGIVAGDSFLLSDIFID